LSTIEYTGANGSSSNSIELGNIFTASFIFVMMHSLLKLFWSSIWHHYKKNDVFTQRIKIAIKE